MPGSANLLGAFRIRAEGAVEKKLASLEVARTRLVAALGREVDSVQTAGTQVIKEYERAELLLAEYVLTRLIDLGIEHPAKGLGDAIEQLRARAAATKAGDLHR